MNELLGAFRRYNRAGEHLTNLEEVTGQIRQLCESGLLAEQDPDSPESWRPSEIVLRPFRLDAGVLVGEIAHNLRAALDYLVYVLAEHDSGTPQSGTQFLIEDHAQGFTGRSPKMLKGVSDEHVAVLRQFQPFKGAEWTGVLRDIDNAAKHREVVSVAIDLNVASILALNEYVLAGDIQFDANGVPIAHGMQMYFKGPVQILLPDGRPVVDTLTHLHEQVAFLLGLFTYEFPAG